MFRSGRRGWRETIKFSIDHLFFKLNLQVIGLPIVVGHALTFGLKSRQSLTCDSVRIVSCPGHHWHWASISFVSAFLFLSMMPCQCDVFAIGIQL